MSTVSSEGWREALDRLLRYAHRAQSDEIAECLARSLPPNVRSACYLVDEEQRHLWPILATRPGRTDAIPIQDSVAGLAFRSVATLPSADGAAWWLPLVDGSERLGVVKISGSLSEADVRAAQVAVNLVGHLIAAKSRYGDLLHQIRRTRRMSVESELLQSSLPPLTFTSRRITVSCVLEPIYDNGGDAFDYSVDGTDAYLTILDATGHGLGAAIMAVTALAALRTTRRGEGGLYAMARAVDEVFVRQFGASAFVTAVLGHMNLESGSFRYINAGHPPPLLLRGGKAVRELSGGRRLPLGLYDSEIEIGEEALEPGDRILLYSDGVTEARNGLGEMFGVGRVLEMAEQAGLAEIAPPELLRLLAHSVLRFSDGRLRDDATLMMAEWTP